MKGHDYAAYRLGRLYLSGEKIEKNIELANGMAWAGCAGASNPYALYTLGKLFLIGEDVPKDIRQALCYFEKAAEGGNEYAEFQLGKLYLLGEDVPKNVEEAITWLSKCARNMETSSPNMHWENYIFAGGMFQGIGKSHPTVGGSWQHKEISMLSFYWITWIRFRIHLFFCQQHGSCIS